MAFAMPVISHFTRRPMATTLFLAEIEPVHKELCLLESACPHCGESLAKGKIEVAGGETVETVYCPFGNCDLRPFTF